MSAQECWQVTGLADEGVTVRVTSSVSASTLAQGLTGSKAMARRVLADGRLERCGQALAPQDVLQQGEVATLLFKADGRPPASPTSAAPEPVEIVYQDRALCAVDKPQGLLVHADGSGAPTLTALLAARLAAQGSSFVPQAVQRLDVQTSGLVLFSLAEELQPRLDAQIAGHEMRKRYLAVVQGRMGSDRWMELDGPIGRDRHDARRMRVSRTGKPSLTRVRAIARTGGRSLLLVELGSGRRHQIRVHLAHAGHPIVGDALYGGQPAKEGLMLHAFEERLLHPVWRTPLELRTAWPARFSRMGFGADMADLREV